MRSELLIFALWSLLVTVAYGKLDSAADFHSDKHLDKVAHDAQVPHPEEAKHEDKDLLPNHVKVYQKFLKAKRKDQVGAVQYMLNIKDPKAQAEFVKKMVAEAESALTESRELLERVKFSGALSDFPAEDSPVKDSITKTVETLAFYCEMALKLPHVIEKRFKKDIKFRTLIVWGYAFSVNFGIYDESSSKMMNLAGQQLEIIPREENFTNPYDRMKIKEEIEREAAARLDEARRAKQTVKKSSMKAGKKSKPSMSKLEL